MAHLQDCDPKDLARLSRTEPAVLEHLARLVGDGLDPVLHVSRGPRGAYELTITGLDGDAVVSEDIVTLVPTDELTRLVLIKLHVEQLVERHERWVRATNPKLIALGVAEISSARSGS